jgi:acetyl-CoA carboxylase carboxyltransferase component
VSEGESRYHAERARIEQGHVKYREKLRAEGKLFVRDRLKLLLDPGTEFQEDFLFARNQEADTPADGVVTGVGTVGGRAVCIMANDYTVKAGSWGEKTVLKIVRIQEKAARLQIPMLYLVDAAGGRISEQIKIFPGRLHAAGSSTTRCSCPAWCRRSASCSGRRRRARPISRRSPIS